MNGTCETCHSEKVCAYEYKPTECANMRKFKQHPDAIDCPKCKGSGYDYPMMCRECNGCGQVLPANVM